MWSSAARACRVMAAWSRRPLAVSRTTRAPVRRIGVAGDVTAAFEVTQQIVDRLSGDLKLLGEFGGALAVEPGIAEHRDVGGVPYDLVVRQPYRSADAHLPHGAGVEDGGSTSHEEGVTMGSAVIDGPDNAHARAWWFLDTLVVEHRCAPDMETIVMKMTLPVGSSAPLHVHDDLDDTWYILDGAARSVSQPRHTSCRRHRSSRRWTSSRASPLHTI
jgi:hypothetical protein